ncbi:hypothetical protein QTH90_20930 [Variovorax sp. J2P1-59]|uniref:hypothetical protein n=1 Tax=Variovorax flavidus TaxID=3053501 RepID=UPI002578B41F|nr:hypothetical protein [Variovorax sp. J2P1-59]MDM0076886.1 hypothetical protein [Variovorax sp. J2P1-59]
MGDAVISDFDSGFDRRALLAVELIDAVGGQLVSRGVGVRANVLRRAPIVSRSGRFVWLREEDRWPTQIDVDVGRLPYEKTSRSVKRPADIDKPTPAERVVTIVLQPTQAYDFPDGVTALRGCVLDGNGTQASPVQGARVSLLSSTKDFGDAVMPRPVSITAEDGGFFFFLPGVARDLERPLSNGYPPRFLPVVLQVEHAGQTRVTGAKFRFLEGAPPGCIREGMPLRATVALKWWVMEPGAQ